MRIKALLLAFALAAIAIPASSQVNPWGIIQPNGYQQITSLSSATALTIPAGTSYAVVCVETQAVRWRDDGVAPTSTVGQPIPAAQCIAYPAPSPNLQFIEQTASAKINASYYK